MLKNRLTTWIRLAAIGLLLAGNALPIAAQQGERVRPVGAADRVAGPAPVGEPFLELGDFRTEDITSAFDNMPDGGIDFVFNPFALGLKVDEGKGHWQSFRWMLGKNRP